jgi:glycosyltransferase involved in cell wall biosynthesis
MKQEKHSVDISILIPAYNEAGSLPSTLEAVKKELSKIKNRFFEIIVIDDGSNDGTKQLMENLVPTLNDSLCKIIYLPLSRNFGKEAAVMAGYKHAKGFIVGCIDADGQHPPSELPAMIKLLEGNPDVLAVVGVRSDQTHKKMGPFSSLFYRLTRLLGDSHLISNGTDFRVMKRVVIDNFLQFREHDRVNRGLMDWLGFKTLTYEFQVASRTAGAPTYSTKKLIRLAIDGLVSSGTKPLLVVLPLGGLVTIFSSIAVIVALLDHFLFRDAMGLRISLQGYVLMIVIFFFGLVFCLLGVLALYIGKIFTEVQGRPHYIINDSEKIT